MKKFFIFAFAIGLLSFTACNSNTTTNVDSSSDTIQIVNPDTTSVDSIAVDTISLK